jgi:hypothetical protein
MVRLHRSVFIVAFLLLASLASAQTSVRYYLVPKIGSGGSMTDPMRPKYVDPDALGPGWNVGPWLFGAC